MDSWNKYNMNKRLDNKSLERTRWNLRSSTRALSKHFEHKSSKYFIHQN
jgi:hypothetical protein